MRHWQKAAILAGLCAGFWAGALPAGAGQAAEAVAVPAAAAGKEADAMQASGIRKVTGIAESFGDGEKVSWAIVEYARDIAPDAVSAADFSVAGRTIEAAYVSDAPEPAAQSRTGRYVLLKLKQENTAFDGDLAQRAGKGGKEKEPRGERPDGGTDAPRDSDRRLPDLAFAVQQAGAVRAADGTIYPAGQEAVAASAVAAPVLDSFRQFSYTDPETGYTMPYNLYLPEGYDPAKKYPLVFFVADASANINEVTTPLFQGNGATVWAEPGEQAKHPCIVLAPQYTKDLVDSIDMMTTDANQWTPGLTLITHLLFDVMDRYSVDRTRIYGTGQSQGGMTNIAISDAYPDLFAAQLLVACQWNVDEMEAMKDKNLWIVVCEGDTKAFPGMNEATARWESLGAKVARNQPFWDSKAPVAELDAKVRALEAEGKKINYSVFAGGNHMYTWSFAYGIDALRDWMFSRQADVQADARPGRLAGHVLDMGIRYFKGDGVEKDYRKAQKYFVRADEMGHFKAARYLGLMAENGWGMAQDDAAAAKWYEKAAAAGDITATCYLGHLYEEGRGVGQDYQKAMELYQKSAARGDVISAPAMVAIGHLYEAGLGVAQDAATAAKWYQRAEATGYHVKEK